MTGATICYFIYSLAYSLSASLVSAAEDQYGHWYTPKQECYDLFWAKMVKEADSLWVEGPLLSCRHNLPVYYDNSLASGHSHGTPKVHYQQLYYEALDSTISSLKDQFN